MEKHTFDYFASCPQGLEELLDSEIRSLGIDKTVLQRGGLSFETQEPALALKVLLQSRLASRVFKLLYSFECHNEKSMYQELAAIHWKSLMDVGNTFRMATIYGKLPYDREVFTNSQFTTLKAKDALVDWFNHNSKIRPSVDKENPDLPFLLRIDDAHEGLYHVQLMLDLCGHPLSQRGYRKIMTPAPLKENLAAGILKILKWDPKEEGLVDGLCGSGTFLIEAALMAGEISPQWLKLRDWHKGMRPWAFLKSYWFTKDFPLQEAFTKVAQETIAQDEKGVAALKATPPVLTGTDNDPLAISAVKENVRSSGLSHIMAIMQMDATKLPAPSKKSLFLCNPPYGERLMPNEEIALKALYHDLGENWKKQWKGHRAAVFTGNLPLLKSISLRTSKRVPLYNGDIECRLAEYELF